MAETLHRLSSSARRRFVLFFALIVLAVEARKFKERDIGVTSAEFIRYIKSHSLEDAMPEEQSGGDSYVNAVVRISSGFVSKEIQWRVTRHEHSCEGEKNKDYFVASLVGSGKADSDTFQMLLPTRSDFVQDNQAKLFICVQLTKDSNWIHLGRESHFSLPSIGGSLDFSQYAGNEVQIRQVRSSDAHEDVGAGAVVDGSAVAQIIAIQLDHIDQRLAFYTDDGVIEVKEGTGITLNVYGRNLGNTSTIQLFSGKRKFGTECESRGVQITAGPFRLTLQEDDDDTWARVDIPEDRLLELPDDDGAYYVCLKADGSDHDAPFLHQGTKKSLKITVFTALIPVWMQVIFLAFLLMLSGLFSGLNLGLMALDQTELKIVQNTGEEKERSHANKIAPVRKHGNYLLCSLLLGNVLVNNSLTVLLDGLTSGIMAVIGATLAIVIFGEIVPQSICSRHALAVGAKTIWLTKLFMALTFPLSFPISLLLDKILGDEIGTVYDKKKLIELLKVTNETNDLEKEEVDIVTGALNYKEKTVRHIMTRIEDIYMLHLRAILNFETISEIREQGYSRIPVHDDERSNIVHILFAKDLMFIDPDDNMPLAMVCEFYNNDVNFVFHDTPLNVMFNEFKSGEKGHMAFVQAVNTSGNGDPFYETIGLVTLEDIIEEIIQQEIVDETDVVLDNRSKKRRTRQKCKDGSFPVMAGDTSSRKVKISPQLTLAVFQYLTTSIDPFRADHMAEVVLRKMLTLDIYREIKFKKKEVSIDDNIIIQKGKAINFFILIIEGRVHVNIGKEELMFESGPFSYFGIQTLMQVLQSPEGIDVTSSPSIVPKSAMSLHSVAVQETPTVGTPKASHLRKASTQNCLEMASGGGGGGNGSSSVVSHGRQATPQQPVFAPFVPDYTVKAITDVLYVRVTRATYIRARKATLMIKKQSTAGEDAERELDNFLNRVNEDDNDTEVTTPILMSPAKSKATEYPSQIYSGLIVGGRRVSMPPPSENHGKKALLSSLKKDPEVCILAKANESGGGGVLVLPNGPETKTGGVVGGNETGENSSLSPVKDNGSSAAGGQPASDAVCKVLSSDLTKRETDSADNRTSLLNKELPAT